MLIDRQTHASEFNSPISFCGFANQFRVVVVVVVVSSLNCFAHWMRACECVAFVTLDATARAWITMLPAVNGILCSINLSTFSFYYLVRFACAVRCPSYPASSLFFSILCELFFFSCFFLSTSLLRCEASMALWSLSIRFGFLFFIVLLTVGCCGLAFYATN